MDTGSHKLRKTIGIIISILCIVGLLMSLMIGLHEFRDAPYELLTRDLVALGNLPLYSGFMSQIGLFLWMAAAGICLFSAYLLGSKSNEARIFLFVSGLFSLLLGFDDAFQVHEEVFPLLGVSQYVILGVYGLLALIYLIVFRRMLLQTAVPILIFSFTFFGISILLDVWHPAKIDPHLFEDSAKLTGIFGWLAYFILLAERMLAHNYSPTDK